MGVDAIKNAFVCDTDFRQYGFRNAFMGNANRLSMKFFGWNLGGVPDSGPGPILNRVEPMSQRLLTRSS